jgi:pimeloyl-ACP methyl ester carboxylesterase
MTDLASHLVSPAQWKAQGEWFDYHGNMIFFNQKGEGEVLLCIHGFPTASWDWHVIWPQLTTEYQLIAPDLLGFGFSDKPKGYNYSIHDQADMIEALLARQGISTVRILAHDYGDTVAQELLSRYERSKGGERKLDIQSICFLNGGLFPETHYPLLIQKLFMSPIGSLVGKMMSRKKLAKNLRNIIGSKSELTEEVIDHLWSLIQYNDGTAVTHRLIRYMKERVTNREMWVGAMQKTEVPICIINGVDDPISGRHMAERYRQLIPNPKVYEMEGVGHFPPIEDPEELLANFRTYQASIL